MAPRTGEPIVKDNCGTTTVDNSGSVDDSLISSPNVNVSYTDIKAPGTCVAVGQVFIDLGIH
jgi:hypothetical protein